MSQTREGNRVRSASITVPAPWGYVRATLTVEEVITGVPTEEQVSSAGHAAVEGAVRDAFDAQSGLIFPTRPKERARPGDPLAGGHR